MAYAKKNDEKASGFKNMNSDVKNGTIPSVILLCGKEQFLVQWSINLIVNKYVNKAAESLDVVEILEDSFSVQSVIESCETFTMFSEKRVVIVKDCRFLNGKKNAKADDGKEETGAGAEESELCEYVKNLPETTILIFACENPARRSKLYKTVKAAGKVYDFDTLEQKDLENFIIKRFKNADKYCKENVLEELITMSGYYHNEAEYTLFNLENDLKKIIAYSAEQEITMADVLSTVSGNMENNVFGMLDALSRGRKDEAYRLLFNMFTAGENVYKLLALIVSQFELMLKIKEMKEEGGTQSVIAEKLGVHPYRVKKAWGFCEGYSVDKLKKTLLKAYEVDKNIKTGLLEQNLALEMFIAQV